MEIWAETPRLGTRTWGARREIAENLRKPAVLQKLINYARVRIRDMWAKVWSWPVIGALVLFLLGGGIAFMTSSHPYVADAFFLVGTVFFLVRFWTWEEAKNGGDGKKIIAIVCVLATLILSGSIYWNHHINWSPQGPTPRDAEMPKPTVGPTPPALQPVKITSQSGSMTFSALPLNPDFADPSLEAEHPGMQITVTPEKPQRHIAFKLQCSVPCVYSRGFGVGTDYATGNVQNSSDSKVIEIPISSPAQFELGQKLVLIVRSKDARSLGHIHMEIRSEDPDQPCGDRGLRIGELHAEHGGDVFNLTGNPCIKVDKAFISDVKHVVVYRDAKPR